MKLPFKERSVSTLVVVPSAIVVAILAVMQYRWSTGVSEATAVRLADSLQMSLVNWQIDFFRYFSELAQAMRVEPNEDPRTNPNAYIRRFQGWKEVAKYPNLVSSVYLLAPGSGEAQRLDAGSQRFVTDVWPQAFAAIRDVLPSTSDWRFDPAIPAMLHKVPGGDPVWVAIELNRSEIQDHIFSDLSHTYFQGTNGLDYLIAVVSRNQPHILYTSDPGFGYPEPADADGAINVFARHQESSSISPVKVFHAPSDDKGPSPSMRISWFPMLREEPPENDWRLVVRHRRGGALGAFVAEMRRRDLAIGFGVLLVLVINMAMLIVTSHRAQRLAELQMNFVTAVSHELRTPLTVIISGADNFRNGVVETKDQMQQYGALIGKQARQLFGLVERILLFAATRQGEQKYNLQTVQAADIIEAALASTRELVEADQFTVERDIAADLPPVQADASALSQCLQNLITNALKYGKDARWLGIRAERDDKEVKIRVADRGIGIGASDLPHIFEPFYRSPAVRTAQIHGTGLGLALSRSIAESMGGRLTVDTAPGQGSTFTVHLPIVQASA